MYIILIMCAWAALPWEALANLDIQPAPASIGADVPITYFGPSPSSVDPRLIGPVQLLKSGTVDTSGPVATVTIPVYYGYTVKHTAKDSVPYFYILTDTTSPDIAASLGVNPSAKLEFAKQPGGYRVGRLDKSGFLRTDEGYVDFSPVRSVVAGEAPNYFPPKSFQPGSMGVDNYSPVVALGSYVYNMPIVADGRNVTFLKTLCEMSKMSAADKAEAKKYVHDKVVNLCLSEEGHGGTVTLQLTTGFSFGKPLLYLSTDAYPGLPASLEGATLVPAFGNLVTGQDDSLFSALERLFTITNGYNNGDVNPKNRTDAPKAGGSDHPLRQGLGSALRDGGGPLNVLGGIPTVATDYSPLWDLQIGEWTDFAVASNYRTRLLDEFTYLGFVQRGYITAPGGKPFASSGAIVNCPPVMRFL